MRTLLASLLLLALPLHAQAEPEWPSNVTPRPNKIQFLCTADVERQCTVRLGGCLGAPDTTSTTCCAAWTMCLNTYHCNAAGLHCRAE
jgi:hypothetical protein